MNQSSPITATGRRKNAVASVKLVAGTGKILVNDKTLDDYFGGLSRHKKDALRAIEMYPSANSYDFIISTHGGGVTGQTGAIKLGIARALIKADPKARPGFKKEGLMTRDPRMVERKKPGRPKARKRFQFSKR
jgi:small subunit ribosomal protein S9